MGKFKNFVQNRFNVRILSEEDLEQMKQEIGSSIQNIYRDIDRFRKDNPSAIEYMMGGLWESEGRVVPFKLDGEKMSFWQHMGWFNFSEQDLKNAGVNIKEGYDQWSRTSGGASGRAQGTTVLRNTQDAAYAKYHLDPHINSVVENYKNYVLGEGVAFYVPNDDIAKFLTPFWNSDIQPVQRRFIQSMTIDGEYFWLLTKRGKTLVARKLYPSEIQGLVLDDNNRDLVRAFKVSWLEGGKVKTVEIPNIEHPEFSFKKNSRGILFTKWSDGDEIRGVVPIETALRPARWAEDFIIDRVILNHERSRVVWFKKIKSAATDVKVVGDTYPHTNRAPATGTTMVVPPHEEWEAVAANIRAAEVKDDYLSIIYLIATAARQPMDIMTQRANEQVYASIKRSANAFHQNILTMRRRTSESFRKLLATQISFGLSKGLLKKKVRIPTLLVEMNHGLDEIDPSKIAGMLKSKTAVPTETISDYFVFIFPNVFTENSKEDTESLDIQRGAGVLSLESFSDKMGLDRKHELVKMIQEQQIAKVLNPPEEEPKTEKE